MLTVVGAMIGCAFLVGGVVCRRRAPAVAAACAGGLVLGMLALYVEVQHPEPDAPWMIALAGSGGLGLAGLVGLLSRPRGEPHSLRAAGIALLAAAPPTAAALTALLATACPMYVQGPSAGLCRYRVDVLGGWVGPTAVLGGLDVVVVGLLLLVSARLSAPARS